MWALSPRIRSMVRWRRINLNADFRSLGQFEVIFCRHVLAGMDPASRQRTLEQLAAALSPGGYLVLSAEEAAAGVSEPFIALAGGVFRRSPSSRAAA
ncbi:MAG: CheR family methyltransferase [Caulobacteraceae bacterium]